MKDKAKLGKEFGFTRRHWEAGGKMWAGRDLIPLAALCGCGVREWEGRSGSS